MDELLKYIKALVYLEARRLSREEPGVAADLILARAGFSYKEIGAVLDKNEMAVAKAVNRAKHAKNGGKDE